MTEQTRDFHIGVVLTITSGRMIAPNMMDDVYDICDFMSGDSNFTHQLVRVSNEIKDPLREQHPELAAVEVSPDLDTWEKINAFFETLYPKFGETVPVAPLAPGVHQSMDPITEFLAMRPDAKILPVVLDSE